MSIFLLFLGSFVIHFSSISKYVFFFSSGCLFCICMHNSSALLVFSVVKWFNSRNGTSSPRTNVKNSSCFIWFSLLCQRCLPFVEQPTQKIRLNKCTIQRQSQVHKILRFIHNSRIMMSRFVFLSFLFIIAVVACKHTSFAIYSTESFCVCHTLSNANTHTNAKNVCEIVKKLLWLRCVR